MTITTSPMTAEEFAVSMKSLIQISPSMFNSLKIYEQVIRAKKIVTTPHFSSTEIIKQVGHLVTLKVDSMDHVVELIGIYVLQNPTTLKTLIEFLSNLDVSNTTDLMETINYLRELSWSITPKQ